jgi:hypothetical protein
MMPGELKRRYSAAAYGILQSVKFEGLAAVLHCLKEIPEAGELFAMVERADEALSAVAIQCQVLGGFAPIPDPPICPPPRRGPEKWRNN